MTVPTLLARQAGVITRSQALAAGLTRHAVDHRVRLRLWWPLHPRVYLVGGHARGPEAAVRAAVLWAGEDAVLDGPAAAWWHGLLGAPPSVVGVTRAHHRPAGRPGVVVRRRDLHPVDVVTVRGLVVTAPAPTLLDAAVALGRPDLLDRALHHGITGAELRAAVERGRGSAGSATAARYLAEAAERAAARARSRLAGLLPGGWVACPLPGGAVGTVHAGARVAVLVDGATDRPAAADAVLRRAGWTVVRCSADEVLLHPERVVAAIPARPAAARCPASRSGVRTT